ncbi:hypothetical protein [Geodermatophilus amargosae]|uniref:hypothetical protein n=1 Tax=Geodermatophilus amargosae TaxID=1296565 RepID=UPI0034E03229
MTAADRQRAAADQLAGLQADREALADRILQPWWYDVALGLLLFGFLASYAFDSPWVTVPAFVLFAAGLGALVAAYRRITGVWIGTPTRAMVLWGGIVLVVLVPALVLAEAYDQRWAMVVAGAVLGVTVGVLSRVWMRAYVAELRSPR